MIKNSKLTKETQELLEQVEEQKVKYLLYDNQNTTAETTVMINADQPHITFRCPKFTYTSWSRSTSNIFINTEKI